MTLRSLIVSLLLILAIPAWAAPEWSTRWDNGDLLAVTPSHNLQLRLAAHPNESTWGTMEIPIRAEQLEALNKHRKDKLFPYIDVAVEVDKYYRTAQGHILQSRLIIKTDLDVRQWEGLKKGSRLSVRLPDGTEFKETLRGSGAALRAVEKRYR